jgi:lambda family phage portal protein
MIRRRTSLEVARDKRELLQERLRIQQLESAIRLYEGGKSTSQRPRRGTGASGDAVMADTGNRLRETARYLEENDGITAGVLDDLVNNIVGTGVTVEPMALLAGGEPADALNRSLRELWEEWHERPEITGEFPGTEMQRMVARTWLRDGEVFVQHVDGLRAPHNSSIPYSLELLEPDYVPMDNVPRQTGNTVIHGVETDAWGRRLAYYVYLQHPGNSLSPFGSVALAHSLLRTNRVPAPPFIDPPSAYQALSLSMEGNSSLRNCFILTTRPDGA